MGLGIAHGDVNQTVPIKGRPRHGEARQLGQRTRAKVDRQDRGTKSKHAAPHREWLHRGLQRKVPARRLRHQVGVGVAWHDRKVPGNSEWFVGRQWKFTTVEAVDHHPDGRRMVQKIFVDKSIAVGVEHDWRQGQLSSSDGGVVVNAGQFDNALPFINFHSRQPGGTALIVLVSIWGNLVGAVRDRSLVVRGIR